MRSCLSVYIFLACQFPKQMNWLSCSSWLSEVEEVGEMDLMWKELDILQFSALLSFLLYPFLHLILKTVSWPTFQCGEQRKKENSKLNVSLSLISTPGFCSHLFNLQPLHHLLLIFPLSHFLTWPSPLLHPPLHLKHHISRQQILILNFFTLID